MTTAAFLDRLRQLDIRVWADGEDLHCNAPAGALTPELRAELRQRKREVLEFLRSVTELSRQQAGIVPLQAHGSNIPVFSFAGHNGDVFTYRPLVRALGADQPFFGLQPPGFDGQSRPLESFEELASYFADQIRAFYPQGPLILAGHCLGGTIVFELARQLRERDGDGRVVMLALFGCPHAHWFRFPAQFRVRLDEQWQRVLKHCGELWRRSWAERLRYPAELKERRHQRLEVENEELHDPALRARMRVAETNMAAIRRYNPKEYSGRVVHFLPNSSWLADGSPSAKWRQVLRRVEEYVGPDDCENLFMLREPHAEVFADLFRRSMAGLASAGPVGVAPAFGTERRRAPRNLGLRPNPS